MESKLVNIEQEKKNNIKNLNEKPKKEISKEIVKKHIENVTKCLLISGEVNYII
jgi:hypothetical protein